MKVSDILFAERIKENSLVLNELKEKLKGKSEKECWMLCLGAGVSISAGLPNWYGLLSKITAQMLPVIFGEEVISAGKGKSFYAGLAQFCENIDQKSGFTDKLCEALEGKYASTFSDINVLESAEYIRNYLEDALEFSPEDRFRNGRGLDGKINSYINSLIGQACGQEWDWTSLESKLKGTTLEAVAGLMKSDKDHLIHSAITYNYDNLLEECLRRLCGYRPCQVHSIDKKDMLRDFGDTEDWNIYHVHGRIPVVEYPGEDESESVILTESDYYQEERINYSWTNILQSYAMLRANLIFIGFSGTDYNFRRIVKYVKQGNMTSHSRYIFFSVNDITEAVFRRETMSGKLLDDCICEMNKPASQYTFEKLLINYLIYAQEVYWEKHGLKVIWSSHEELSKNLKYLH